jgi:hypothetical protein
MTNYDQIKDYFLGQLPESEQLKVEEAYFANPEALQELRADFDDLIDDYLRGKLSLQEQRKFDQRLNQLPAISEKVETDRALRQALTPPPAIANHSNQRTGSTRRWSFSQWWSELSFPAAVTAVLVLGFMVAGIWYRFTPEKTQVVRQEVTNKEVPPPLPEKAAPASPSSPKPLILRSAPQSVQSTRKNEAAPVIASFLLSAEIIRGNEEAVILPITADVTTLRLQLELTAEAPKNLRVVLQTKAGATIKVWESLPVVYQKSTPLVVLNLSAASLANADYIIKLSNALPPQEFHFRLQKK